jgi:magnesium chelatase family protein
MPVARAETVALVGLDGHPVEVEVAIAPGLPAFLVVGLPDASVQEARERVRAAVVASGERWPLQRITVNLSPAHLRKAGPGFDLPIAVALLAAAGRISAARLRDLCVLGELSLDGAVRRVRGALASALAARRAGKRAILLPRSNGGEAALVGGIRVLPVGHLAEAIRFLRGEVALEAPPPPPAPSRRDEPLDLADVRGQTRAKRALEVAAAGAHNLLLWGPPGGGKTMLARRLPGILPPLSHEEALEVTRIYSVAGLLPDDAGLLAWRPFRAPHHSASLAGLVGGGSAMPLPGEVSLAHRGVLFLDEAGEFRRDVLQALRGPLEDGTVTIVRGRWAVTYPARFQLVAATNPCPCGHLGDPVRPCRCLPGRLAAYAERLSGPVLDRIDIRIEMERLPKREIFRAEPGEPSAVVRQRVVRARERQAERLAPLGIATNAEIPPQRLAELVPLRPGARRIIEDAVEAHGLTARGVHRALRVARTIADLAGTEVIEDEQALEAVSYRVTERAP